MPHAATTIQFRLLAIAGSGDMIEHLLMHARHRHLQLGIMLRDPMHRRSSVEQLVALARSITVPPSTILLSNSFVVPGVAGVHMTSRQLMSSDDPDLCSEGGSGMIHGFSCHDDEQIRRAEDYGADYITLGPVFPTDSKPDHPGIGLDRLECLCASTRLPVFALGGVDARNFRDCLQAGAWGIAAVSALSDHSRGDAEVLFEYFSQQ